MRALWFVALLILWSGAAQAQEAKPNALTPQQIADGWIMLFDGETDFGWKPLEGTGWHAQDGALAAMGTGRSILATTTVFGDFELTAEASAEGEGQSGLCLQDASQNAAVLPQVLLHPGKSGKWQPLTVRAEGNRLTLSLNGKRVRSLPRSAGRNRIALYFDGKGGTVRFRCLFLRPLGLKSLFNGRDLTGWTVIPGHKSVYSVTPEGWLNVKNGNGDIQTEGQWGDFVLQLEVFSNGDHLNSGVFFRGEPGRFWQGYECQIRNQWQGDDRTRPVDYGTGAIYNRQAARKVVSSDREWFTMTIVAHGTHLASWVNGYQTADFTDTRPPDETNARRGARVKPGVISLQGHDPTTDLSFRNIRAAELPATH
jgi:hypothetical protein